MRLPSFSPRDGRLPIFTSVLSDSSGSRFDCTNPPKLSLVPTAVLRRLSRAGHGINAAVWLELALRSRRQRASQRPGSLFHRGGVPHRDAGGAAGAEALQLWPASCSQGSGRRRFLGVPWRLALVCR